MQIGVWDVDGLAEEISVDQLWRWMAFSRICPWGDDWRRTGRLASIVAASAGARVDDMFEDKFMPGSGRLRGMTQTEVEMLEELKKIPELRGQIEKRR